MMEKKNRPAFLKLVQPPAVAGGLEAADFSEMPALQPVLFQSHSPTQIVFVNPTDLDGGTAFFELILETRPRVIGDLRKVPRFDFDHLTRRGVFDFFETIQTRYVDFSQRRLSGKSLKGLNQEIVSTFQRLEGDADGRVFGGLLFLLDEDASTQDIFSLAQSFPSTIPGGWEILVIPRKTEAEEEQKTYAIEKATGRTRIFISHASPEDNDIAVWLAIKLQNLGYEVWADFSELRAGERFWDVIETQIRFESAKVLVLLSEVSQTKSGVLDEINLALMVEKQLKDDRFVIPIKIGGLAFESIRVNLARKNIVNFSDGWTKGLTFLLDGLEKDNVPRRRISEQKGADLKELFMAPRSGLLVEQKPERLVSNWLPITKLPDSICVYSADLIENANSLVKFSSPVARHGDLLFTFSNAESPFAGQFYKGRVSTEIFLTGQSQAVKFMGPAELRRVFALLLNNSWKEIATSRGLVPYEMSAGRMAYFFNEQNLNGKKFSFVDFDGRNRTKSLTGRSEKRNVHWHYALEFKAYHSDKWRFIVRSHVLFSQDGKTILESKDRLHQLRRSFCKSWWNDRWRELQAASLNWLAAGHSTLTFSRDTSYSLFVSALPAQIITNLSLVENNNETPEDSSDNEDELVDYEIEMEKGL